jgi:anti-sigma B factor antagonist
MSGEALAVHESDREDVRVLEVFGELDIATAPRLCAAIDAARIHRVKRLMIDMTGVDFCDSTGLRALIGAGCEIRMSGGRLAIACLPGGAVARLFDVVGIRERLLVCDSPGEALSAVAHVRT